MRCLFLLSFFCLTGCKTIDCSIVTINKLVPLVFYYPQEDESKEKLKEIQKLIDNSKINAILTTKHCKPIQQFVDSYNRQYNEKEKYDRFFY